MSSMKFNLVLGVQKESTFPTASYRIVFAHLVWDSRREICYSIDFEIESLLFLGDPNNVYASKAYVAPHQLNVFYEIPLDGSFTPSLDLDKALIIHMFPINNRSIETDDGNCFPIIQQNIANAPVHIWASALGATRYRVVDMCKNPLNFGFNDLLAPNMVFVRSNLINEIGVPKRLGCLPSEMTKCQQYTTTVRPPPDPSQLHTPQNHKTLYYDLANVTPDQKEKLRQRIPIDPFHSVELMEPAQGNFSRLISGRVKEIELPILMDSQAFRKFLNLNQYQVLNQTVEKLRNAQGKVESLDERELIEDILEDILTKDANILKMVTSPEQNSDELEDKNQSSENFHEEQLSILPAYHLGNESNHSDFFQDETKENTKQEATNNENSIKKRSLASTVSYAIHDVHKTFKENFANSNEPLAFNDKDFEHHNNVEDPPFDFSLLISPSNINKRRLRRKLHENHKVDRHLGVCKGIHTPPTCEDEQFRSKRRKHKKLQKNMEEITNSTRSLVNLMQRFNNATQKYGFLQHISSIFDKSVDFLGETCVIPVKVVKKESIKTALHILLSQLDVNELKNVYGRLSSEIIMKNGNRFLQACRNGSGLGLIDFLFEERCPFRVSCTKYTTGSGSSVKVISGLQNLLSPKMNVLSTTLEAVARFMRFMCKSNLPEMNAVANEFARISSLFLIKETKNNLAPWLSEKVIQSYLKIPSLEMYWTLLSKCVSAAATISVNGKDPLQTVFRMKKTRMKRSPVKPLRVFDGIAICMNSYWDGVNESPDHKCVPPPV
ncbi:hypothetical protein Ocin01_13201 [Orchesella cincta]|uniref:Uncharacterized protein n=1 Tax=Orchesella cincta TaxID=48709 RepID=A0A1D2MKH5_ORCCI|nr:hypothetical protein Ocin01_13201 [Orchesella cincta]